VEERAAAVAPPTPLEAEAEAEVHTHVNGLRRAEGLRELTRHRVLDELAREHSQAMAAGRRPVGHAGLEERQARASVEVGWRAIAENVAFMPLPVRRLGAVTAEGWMASPPHRRNLLGQYRLVGTGVARAADDRFYVTQIYVLQ
jgi:uncharacterized protein YkwD